MKKLVMITAALCVLNFPLVATANTDAPSAYLEQALSKLPQEKAENFRDSMQQAHEENKDLYDQVQQLHEDMHKIMTADKFDEVEFASKSKELRQLHEKIAANLDEGFVHAIADLSPGERKKLARALEHTHQEKQAMKKAE